MALGGIQMLGGLFGGGPRAPRMQECQQQQCMQNPFPNQACAMNMALGANGINGAANAFMGQPFGGQFGGPISNFAMAGAGPGGSFAFAGNNGLGNGFNNLFQPQFGGGGNPAYSAGFQAGLSGGAYQSGFQAGLNGGLNGGFNGGFNSGGFGNGLGFGSPFAGGLPFGGQNLNLSLGISLNV